ncbi:COX15/CtaA family protein [Emticicia sp. SJ17W-69]|uniref:COX15/CtaA family protein n=1 Tax=Emticicia sp. SJ17W-69 TaxID=3421657 RepID=UPI003EB7E041
MILFRKLGLWTIGAVYLLILVGGVVRATGSGMGCPDWPKCFGSWVPPTDISQLPANYKEIFGEKLKGEIEFNALKTWIEYVNRLLGVLIGFLIFGTFLSSFFAFWKKDKTIVLLSFFAFILVGIEGWLGSKVVSSELHPVMITLHMILSMVIVFILLYAVARSYNTVVVIENVHESRQLSFLVILTILLTLGQILLGTQVREMIDTVSGSMGNELRSQWVENIGGKFQIHGLFSIVVLSLNLFLFYRIRKNISVKGIIYKLSVWLLILILVEMLSGITLAYYSFPALMQPIHLTFATVALGIQFIIYLFLNKDSVFRSIASPQ